MAEEIKTSTRGRKPNAEKKAVVENKGTVESKTTNDNDAILSALMVQMEMMKKELEESKKEKGSMQELIEALKGGNGNTSALQNLPNKVRVISLLRNPLNLSTVENGMGVVFSFRNYGDMVTMKTSQLEEILSIQGYRKQAEDMYYYICDEAIVESQDLSEFYENINKETLDYISTLQDDKCVEMLGGLSKGLRRSVCMGIAESMSKGENYDRNRLGDIQRKYEIDIEKMVSDLKEIEEHRLNKAE